jgi:hypothetical protein
MRAQGGAVTELRRYPVKSMLGERVERVRVTDRGLAGDRAYALLDVETGKVASAKHPRRWGVLFSCTASFLEEPDVDDDRPLPPVRIQLPDGSSVRSDEAGVDDVLTAVTRRPVRLTSDAPDVVVLEEEEPDGSTEDHQIGVLAPNGTFFDGAAVHLLTTSSIETFTASHPSGQFDPRRFRVNVVVDTAGAEGFVENSWVGHHAVVGDELDLNVVIPVPRCVMTTLPLEELPADREILQTAARENRLEIPMLGPRPCVGVYGIPTNAGTIATGDLVTLH